MADKDYQAHRDKKIEEITTKALELKELNKRAIEAILSNDVNRFLEIYVNFYKIREVLNDDLHGFGVLTINDENARSIINKISIPNETFEVENIYNELKEMIHEAPETKVGELLFDYDLFDKAFQWFHAHYDSIDIFVRRYSFGPIALKLTKHAFIDGYITEAFECYSFGNYNALSSMCRTIIEAAIIDICLCKGIVKKNFPDNTLPSFYINILTTKGNPLNDRIWDIYGKASRVVHGKVTRDGEYAKDLLKETIKIVQDLYEVHGLL
jgi:hypothetical protein